MAPIKRLNPKIELTLEGDTIKTNMFGKYNVSNLLISIAIGKYFGVHNSDIKIALEKYKPSNNRSQILETENNKLILDAYNANPSSVMAAIDSFKQLEADNKIAVIGDMMELGNDSLSEHKKIYKYISEIENIKSYFIGSNFDSAINDKDNSFISIDDFISFLETTNIKNSIILIKGSRYMSLEKLTKHL